MMTLSTAAQIALVFLGVLAAVGTIGLAIVALQLRRIAVKLETKAGPVLDRGAVVAANLEVISARVRSDVDRVSGSVEALTDRLNEASAHMEDRLNEFNALMEVVQGEAEGVFLETAATVRGIKAGARQLSGPQAAAADRKGGTPTVAPPEVQPALQAASEGEEKGEVDDPAPESDHQEQFA